MIRNTSLPPVIEMRLVTERKFVERLLFLDIYHLITDNEYTIRVYKISSKGKFFVFGEFFLWARDLILFY